MPDLDDTTTNEDIDFFSEEARQVLLLFFVGTVTLAERLALAAARLVQIVETLNSEENRERIAQKAMRDLTAAGQQFSVGIAALVQEVQRTTKR